MLPSSPCSPSRAAAALLRRAVIGTATTAGVAIMITGCWPLGDGASSRPLAAATAAPVTGTAAAVPPSGFGGHIPTTTPGDTAGATAAAPGSDPALGSGQPAAPPAGSTATGSTAGRPPSSPGAGTAISTPAAAAPAQPPAPPPAQPLAAPASGRIQPGTVYRGRATHYGADGGGNCMFDRLNDPAMPVVAMNEADYETARACGAYIQVTGPGGSVVVKVTDRCPECAPGQLDLSEQAFARIAGGVPGLVDVTWRLASPSGLGAVQYKVKEGSSAYWLALQVRQHRNLVTSLEVRVNGVWTPLRREMWNYFIAPNGLGPGPFTVRITDVFGERLVHTVSLSPGTTQQATGQFAQR
ncbi:Peptidoglycan-binding domain-containing protein, expansin [Parafrankia irregularis]|uniref:Peptidoglycan-binding domain-containing protein, expansin n=1 Tax=Parafrankia irregularis TaxID=795642 RepID=A0A0S4QW14_9ACTN|nr:expansin EXLX1 family cellulose-binding protein [Parafrankia irregularis]CUU59809.1 Peptidoglycan-binding domain-containing protein, expansin [Parafrankia irregularis]